MGNMNGVCNTPLEPCSDVGEKLFNREQRPSSLPSQKMSCTACADPYSPPSTGAASEEGIKYHSGIPNVRPRMVLGSAAAPGARPLGPDEISILSSRDRDKQIKPATLAASMAVNVKPGPNNQLLADLYMDATVRWPNATNSTRPVTPVQVLGRSPPM
jgi:hypothetical protein